LCKADDVASSLFLNDILSYEVGQLKTNVIAAQRKRLLDVLVAKPLHGKFFTWLQSSDVNALRSFRWLQCSLHSESESSVFAVRDRDNVKVHHIL